MNVSFFRIDRLSKAICATLALLVILAASATPATACPFCGEKTRTLSEQLADAEFAVLAQWVSTLPESDAKHATKYEILQIVRGQGGLYKVGQFITLERTIASKPGNQVLLLGKRPATGKSELAEWRDPIEVSEVSFQYIVQAPSPEAPAEKRLQYFGKFLEYPDELISVDAYGEFANADYKDIVPVARKIPPERLRKWIFEPNGKGSKVRRGLYGMMLGLSGDAADAARLGEIVLPNPSDEPRLGIDGMIGGYLLIKGADGLKLVEQEKLAKPAVPYSEIHQVMTALRFMWSYCPERIPAARLQGAMRLLLNTPYADLAITDLARWKDWELQPRLFKMYADADRVLKTAIIRFMFAGTLDVPKGLAAKSPPERLPEHARRAQEYVAEFRKQDPRLVREAGFILGMK